MMKRPLALLILLPIALLGWRCHTVKHKPPRALFIDRPSFFKSPTGHGDSTTMLATEVLLINNTNDTLVYGEWWGQESQFYRSDNENLVATNSEFWGRQPVHPDTIWPQSSSSKFVHFRFKSTPDTTFTFRIGMSLLKWQKKYSTTNPNARVIRQAPVLWSGAEAFKTDRKHQTYDKTPEECKKQCEQVVYPLTDDDRRNYILGIEQNKISRLKDTMAFYLDSTAYGNPDYAKYKQFGVVTVPLKLSNNSDSTLTYTNWNCTWHEAYQTNNKEVSLLEQFCSRNFPETFSVSPHSSSVLSIPVLFDKKAAAHRYKFRIGMVLLRGNPAAFGGFSDAFPLFKRDPKYVIWSNEVEVTAGK